MKMRLFETGGEFSALGPTGLVLMELRGAVCVQRPLCKKLAW